MYVYSRTTLLGEDMRDMNCSLSQLLSLVHADDVGGRYCNLFCEASNGSR